MWEADPKTLEFLFVSRQAERLLGYPLAEWFAVPNAWLTHLHPDDCKWVLEYCLSETKAGRSHDLEYRMIAADGRTVWLRDLVNVGVEDGVSSRLRGVMLDITERKQAEEGLRRSEGLFRALIEHSWDAVALFGAEGKILYGSPSTTRVLGCGLDDFVGRNIFEFFRSDDLELAKECVRESLQKPGQGIALHSHMRYKDGTWRVVEGLCTNLLQDPSVRAVVYNYRDVTRRDQAERALRQSKQRFRDFAEIASDWFWESERDHRFTFISSRPQGSPIDHSALLGRRRWEVAADQEDEPEKWKEHRRVLERHEPFRDFVYKAAFRHGSTRFVSVSGKPVFDEGGRFEGYRGVGRDVTDAIEADRALREAKTQAEAANEAKSSFLKNMSHELRTPLNAIIGFTDLLGSGLVPLSDGERYRDYVNAVHASALHLLEIIDDMLDVARIEAGKLELNEQTICLNEIIASVARMMAQESKRAGLSVHHDMAPNLPHVRGDERALRQVLLNLVSNAVKFTESGGKITVGVRHDESGDIRLWVADTGIGIAASDIPKLMQPFTQLGDVYQKKRPGTGLGLALARSLVELHGGSIAIESVPSTGTTVTVRLPHTRVLPDGRVLVGKRSHECAHASAPDLANKDGPL